MIACPWRDSLYIFLICVRLSLDIYTQVSKNKRSELGR